MPEVRIDLLIQASIDSVWKTIIDIEHYQESMDHVRSVRVVEELEVNARRVAWSVLLKGSVLEWVEEERFDPGAHTIDFKQMSGDLEYFAGRWALEANGAKETTVNFEVVFEIGIPSLADMLNPVAQRSLGENCLEMLRGIERRAAIE